MFAQSAIPAEPTAGVIVKASVETAVTTKVSLVDGTYT